VVVESVPLRPEFLAPKLKRVTRTMRDSGIDLWVTFTREGNQDPVSEDIRFGSLSWRSAAVIDADGGRTAIVGSFEVETVKARGFYDEVFGYGSEGAAPKLREVVSKRKPKKIAVNTSYDFGAADGLSTGMDAYLRKALKGRTKASFVSSEALVVALKTVLVPGETKLMRRSVELCEKIYRAAEQEAIRPGRTDKQVYDFMVGQVREMGLQTAWSEANCPSVLIGSDPAGHMGYYGSALKVGQFLKLDFGVRYEGYCSDIQHDYWVGRRAVPRDVKEMFKTARAANDAALAKLKPGVKGHEVDAAARKVVTTSGYDEFMHATGHPLGRSTHELGPLLGPLWPWRYGRSSELVVQKDMVFTVEPTVVGKGGTCNLEQDVLVTSKGYEELSPSQDELITIG
jgi:Xaa-Pro aminopeptidase